MTRYLALLGLHFVINFGLLPGSGVISHPVHHDDYSNLAASLEHFRLLSPRPISTLAIAGIAALGADLAYLLINLLVVGCVFLCLKFVELFVRGGRPLPAAGFLAAGALAFSFAAIVDWTKYFGLLTNLCSALPGLAALCAIAKLHNDEEQARLLVPLVLLLAALSFFAKEDFALPIIITTACLAVLNRTRRWVIITAAVALLFAAALLFNRMVGSVFVSGTRSPLDPYFVDLSPTSLVLSFARLLIPSSHARLVAGAALASIAIAVIVHRRDRPLAVKLAALAPASFSMLAPYSIFPNHAFAYYGFVSIAMLAATTAVATYAAAGKRRGE